MSENQGQTISNSDEWNARVSISEPSNDNIDKSIHSNQDRSSNDNEGGLISTNPSEDNNSLHCLSSEQTPTISMSGEDLSQQLESHKFKDGHVIESDSNEDTKETNGVESTNSIEKTDKSECETNGAIKPVTADSNVEKLDPTANEDTAKVGQDKEGITEETLSDIKVDSTEESRGDLQTSTTAEQSEVSPTETALNDIEGNDNIEDKSNVNEIQDSAEGKVEAVNENISEELKTQKEESENVLHVEEKTKLQDNQYDEGFDSPDVGEKTDNSKLETAETERENQDLETGNNEGNVTGKSKNDEKVDVNNFESQLNNTPEQSTGETLKEENTEIFLTSPPEAEENDLVNKTENSDGVTEAKEDNKTDDTKQNTVDLSKAEDDIAEKDQSPKSLTNEDTEEKVRDESYTEDFEADQDKSANSPPVSTESAHDKEKVSDSRKKSSIGHDDTLEDIEPLTTTAEITRQDSKVGDQANMDEKSEVTRSEVEKSADDNARADEMSKRGSGDDTDHEAEDIKTEEVDGAKSVKTNVENEESTPRVNVNEGENDEEKIKEDEEDLKNDTVEEKEKVQEESSDKAEKDTGNVDEESPAEPEAPPREPTPEPEPPKITRNINIDHAVSTITGLEGNLTDLMVDMKELISNYQERIDNQPMSDFSSDLDKFKGDFHSLKDAYKTCETLFHFLHKSLKDMRMSGDNLNMLIQKKFRNEDLTVWLEEPDKLAEEKEKLKEERIAVEKSALARAAEARAAIARAAVNVTESSLFAAEVEAEAAEAEGVSKRAWETAEIARRDVEEAKKAAEEKRKAEEEARKRAEERARKKAEEERIKQEEEDKKLQEEAERKGTSFEDEKQRAMEEKARKEAERKNPKNWPRYIFSAEAQHFDPGVGCVVRAIEGSMTRDDVIVACEDQLTGILTLVENEELISNIISIKPTDPEKKFQFEEPVSIAIPHCLQRNIPGRESVVKQLQPTGKWVELPTNDVIIDDIRELRFVEVRTRRFGVFAVVLRIKRDNLMLIRKGNKVNSTVDARISFTCRPGMFKNNVHFTSEVQALDVNTVTDLNKRYPVECGSLLSSSPILRFQIPNRKFTKPLVFTLPLPPNSQKLKRPKTAAPGSGNKEKTEGRENQGGARPVSSMGFSPKEEEQEEEMHLLVRDDKGPWTVQPNVELIQPKNKDIVVFEIKEPRDRYLILKTKPALMPMVIERMGSMVENAILHRTMQLVLRQRTLDPCDIIICCTPANRTDKLIKKLAEEGYDDGPLPSKEIIVKEGQILDIQFRGNIKCIDGEQDKKLLFNSFIRGRIEFSVEEIDQFAQKSFPFYRGFAQMFTKVMVPKQVSAADKAKMSQSQQKPVAVEMVEDHVLLAELPINIPKPEAEPPKPLATAPIRVSAEGPNKEDILSYVAAELGDEWKKLAQLLNLKTVRIQAILRQNTQNSDPKKTRYDMLVTWAKRVPRCLNKLEILAQALSSCGRGDLAAELRERDAEYKRKRSIAYRDTHLKRAFVKVAQNPEAVHSWRNIAMRLGVAETELVEIDQGSRSVQEKCFSSLQKWQTSAGEGATLPILTEKLRTCKYKQLARDIETIG